MPPFSFSGDVTERRFAGRLTNVGFRTPSKTDRGDDAPTTRPVRQQSAVAGRLGVRFSLGNRVPLASSGHRPPPPPYRRRRSLHAQVVGRNIHIVLTSPRLHARAPDKGTRRGAAHFFVAPNPNARNRKPRPVFLFLPRLVNN